MSTHVPPRLPDVLEDRRLIVWRPDFEEQPHESDVIASKIDAQRDQMGGVAPVVFAGEVEDGESPRANDEPIDVAFTINASPPSPTSPPIPPKRTMATNAPKNAPTPKAAVTTIWSAAAPARTVADIQKKSGGSAQNALKAKFLNMRGVSTAPTVAKQESPAAAPTAPKAVSEAEKPAKAEKQEKPAKKAA